MMDLKQFIDRNRLHFLRVIFEIGGSRIYDSSGGPTKCEYIQVLSYLKFPYDKDNIEIARKAWRRIRDQFDNDSKRLYEDERVWFQQLNVYINLRHEKIALAKSGQENEDLNNRMEMLATQLKINGTPDDRIEQPNQLVGVPTVQRFASQAPIRSDQPMSSAQADALDSMQREQQGASNDYVTRQELRQEMRELRQELRQEMRDMCDKLTKRIDDIVDKLTKRIENIERRLDIKQLYEFYVKRCTEN